MAVTSGPKPVSADTKRRYLIQRAGYALLAAAALAVVVPILYVIGMVVVQGIAAINWEFIFGMPSNGMKSGGIWPAIVGTIILTLTTAVISIPLGVGGAIYLSEYARDTKLTRSIRLALVNLAGIPSVVYGLFGLGMFVIFLGFGTSILAGALTLAIMTLPVMISAAEEALRAVPMEFRTVSASLGGTRWQGVNRIVLPQALPGIITGVILGLLRADGRDRAHPLHGGRILSAADPEIALRPDDGAAVPPLRHQHAGAWDAAEDTIRHGAGAVGVRAVAEHPGDRDPQLLPTAAAVVVRGA